MRGALGELQRPAGKRKDAVLGDPVIAIEELADVEDWQAWQIRADQVASALQDDVNVLEREFSPELGEPNFRTFWPRFRELKERVRTAPAIQLEAKLALERRLRDLGSRAYKRQEAAYAQSQARKDELLAAIAPLRSSAEQIESPKELRSLRRELDGLRTQFESGPPLMPPDRQAVWEAWREASQFVWQRLTAHWEANEERLRELLAEARKQAEASNANAVRQAVGRFYDALKSREARQSSIAELKQEAAELRNEAAQIDERKASQRAAAPPTTGPGPIDGWKAELGRNRDAAGRLLEEVATLEEQFQQTRSILDQAMLRGTLVDKRRKLAELEHANRSLEQRIEQAEESPLMSTG